MSDETAVVGGSEDPKISFKVKTSSDGMHTITMAESATVLDLKNKLAGSDYENIPADRQRLIYSGRVMKNEEPLGTYKIKNGNTIHMVKSAQSNAAQNPASAATSASTGSAPRAAAGVPTNMAAGTANNPLAGLTGARYAGHMGLPGADMFGADGGMGAPPSEDQLADMLSNPATAQMMNEALNNPAMIDMMIQSNPQLQAMGPEARRMLQSPMFRQMMTNPDMLRQAAAMRRMMNGGTGGGSSFPAPGVTDTTPTGAAGTNATSPGQGGAPGAAGAANPFGNLFGAGGIPGMGGGSGGANPFASLLNPGAGFPFAAPSGTTPAQSPPPPASAGQGSPSAQPDAPPANPFAAMFGGGGSTPGNPFGMTPEQLQQMQQMAQQIGMGDLLGGTGGLGAGGAGGAQSPPLPTDTRPPEEMYAEQLRQLNDMGFFDFDQNVQALRRAGGSVQGAINSLLGG
ncbi:MAG: hypothetical protein M1818_002063 [Claussenomyces sp. TS43310]|nr:MAG: hypothetical protein M1818_002063 [Claussenomyces sp. TS43310]